MPEELRVGRSLVDRASWLRDEARMAKIALERLVVGTEGPGSADPGEGDDVGVIRLAEAGGCHLGLLAGDGIREVR